MDGEDVPTCPQPLPAPNKDAAEEAGAAVDECLARVVVGVVRFAAAFAARASSSAWIAARDIGAVDDADARVGDVAAA